MTYEERNQRHAELRAMDPCGQYSNSDLDRIVDGEDIDEQIDALPDTDDAQIDLKHLLRNLKSYIDTRS